MNIAHEQILSGSVRRFKSFDAYKDSGFDWLGKVPATWEIKRIRAVLRDRDGIKIGPFGSALKSEFMQQEGYKVYGQEHVISGNFCSGDKYVAEAKFNELATCEILPGDLVVSMMGTTGKCQVVPDKIERGIMDSHLLRIRPKDTVYPPLLARLINESDYIRYQVSTNSKGSIMEGLNSSIIKNLFLFLPSLGEQRIIEAFLDRETGRIDNLITKKERQIELLREKRSALISHVVTKGLNPNAQMKDSGIEWLGKIPAHWKVMRLRHVGDAIIGLTYDPADVVDEHEGTLVLRASNVSDGRIVLDDNVYVRTRVPERLVTKAGDILICSRSGSRALIGKSAKIDKKSAGVTFGTFMTIFRSPCNDYLFYVCNSKLFDYQSGAFLTSTINQLTVGNLYSFEVPIPPPDEQTSIASFLGRETSRIDRLSRKVKDSIAMLLEHRAALITAAVTGKIDVREEVA